MAKKTNVLRTLMEAYETAAMKERQPLPPTAALYELRPHAFKVSSPRTRMQIGVQFEEESELSCVIKIIHTDPN